MKQMSKTIKKLYISISLLLLTLLLFPIVLFSQNTLLSDNTLKKYLPDNFTGYTALKNYTLVLPTEYGKLAVGWYSPNNSIDNTTNVTENNNLIRLVILNLNKLGNDNGTILQDNQTIDASGNLCKTTRNNVIIDNFTGTLLTNNCVDGTSFSLYLPVLASDNYLLAVNAEGPNSNDLINLLNAIDLNGLMEEVP